MRALCCSELVLYRSSIATTASVSLRSSRIASGACASSSSRWKLPVATATTRTPPGRAHALSRWGPATTTILARGTPNPTDPAGRRRLTVAGLDALSDDRHQAGSIVMIRAKRADLEVEVPVQAHQPELQPRDWLKIAGEQRLLDPERFQPRQDLRHARQHEHVLQQVLLSRLQFGQVRLAERRQQGLSIMLAQGRRGEHLEGDLAIGLAGNVVRIDRLGLEFASTLQGARKGVDRDAPALTTDQGAIDVPENDAHPMQKDRSTLERSLLVAGSGFEPLTFGL